MRCIWVSILAVMVAALAESASAAGLTVKGDAQAWKEIEAAFVKMVKAKSYRAKGKSSDGATLLIEYVSPDRHRYVQTDSDTTFETIVVGTQSRVRQGNGPWMCQPGGLVFSAPNLDASQMTGEVTASRGPAATIAGVQTRSYSYRWKDAGDVTNGRVYIAVPTGFLKRLEMLDEKGAVEQTLDYSDYNAPIAITLPACR